MVKERKVLNVMTFKYLLTLIISFVVYTGNIFILNIVVGVPLYPSVIISLAISYVVNYALYEKLVFVEKSSGSLTAT